MAAAYDALAARAAGLALEAGPGGRAVVGVAGAPGAGKSTLARAVADRTRALLRDADACVVLPMDGFHLTRAQLAAMDDPEAAKARRGAPFTFDAPAFVAAVRAAAVPGAALSLPSFDHGVGDPVDGGVAVAAGAKVVLVEGNYVLLATPPWSALANDGIFTESWFVEIPNIDVAMARVFARQTRDGVPPGASMARIRANDRPNAELVAECVGRADIIVRGDLPEA